MRSLRWIAVLAATLIPASGFADAPTFTNINTGDFDKMVKELSANFAYSSVTPASSLGSLWGFELGVVGGITKTPEILALVKRNNPNFKEDKFPHAAALARIGAPLGLAAEAMILPTLSVSDLKLKQYAGAVQWTITDIFFEDLPVNLAVKAYFTKTNLNFAQRFTVSGLPVDGTIDYDNNAYGGQLLISKKLLVFEPYVGIGFAKAKGELDVNAATSANLGFFASNTRSAASSPSTVQLLGGLDIRLAFFSLGAEYQKAFGTSSFSGRASFRF